MMIGGTGEVMRKALYDAFSLPAFILLFTMMGFGSLARGAGFGAEMAALATVLIWGLPGQLAMVELTATGQGLVGPGRVWSLSYAPVRSPTRDSCRWWCRSCRRCRARARA